ncbi:MAG: hypothetical protein EAZ95_05000 [Bacteroidetes bacterium]|nr:MAG: hypothetical protein EAZ95_05000 [Bacteroidota bacterium]
MQIQLHKLLSLELCYTILRELRWEDGISCPHCSGTSVSKMGKMTATHSASVMCVKLVYSFDDLTSTIFLRSHYPLTTWITALYLMNLNVSNAQIGAELDISPSSASNLCSHIREGVVQKKLLYCLAEKLNLTNVIS